MYELIDHTADVGIRVEGESLAELFEHAAEGLFGIMIEKKRSGTPAIEVPISLEAPAVDQLLVRWLSELLFVFETRRLVFSKFFIDEISETRLEALAFGAKYDSTRHRQKLEIKAVTYHHIKVEQREQGPWQAEVIFDI
jgi:SHS2 domain-containing protein